MQKIVGLCLLALVAFAFCGCAKSEKRGAFGEELLELNKDGFVGKPLSADLNDAKHQIWYGQLTSGDWVVGLFNREDEEQHFSLSFEELGLQGEWSVRDMWRHEDEGECEKLEMTLQAHACKVVRLRKS